MVLDLEKLRLSYRVMPLCSVVSFRCCEICPKKVIFAYILHIQVSGILNTAGQANSLGP